MFKEIISTKPAILTMFVIIAVLFTVNSAFAGKQKFSELESYTMKEKLIDGSNEVEITVHSRDWGRCVVQLTGKEKSIVLNNDNEQIVVYIDLAKNQGIKTVDPGLKEAIAQLKGKSQQEFMKETMVKLGGKQTGSKIIAGEKCNQWEVQGGTTCITDDGIPIQTVVPGTYSRTLLKLKRNDPGPKNACDYSNVNIEEVDMQTLSNQRQQ